MKKPLLECLKIIIITAMVYFSVRYLLPLVLPFFIALLAAKLMHPIVERLNRFLKIKKGLISVFVSGIFLLITGRVLWGILKRVFTQARSLFDNMDVFQEKIEGYFSGICNILSGVTGIHADTINSAISERLPDIWGHFQEKVLPVLMNGSLGYAKNIFFIVGVGVITCVSTVLILNDYTNMREKLRKSILGNSCLKVCRRVYSAGGAYFKSQLIIMAAVSVVCMIGLFFAGNEYALVAGWGIGLCDALPFLGTGTIFIPWAILQIADGKYMIAAIYAAIYVICTLLREILEPKLLGDRLGIHPVMILISIYIGLYLYGIWGFAMGPFTYILIKEIWKEIKVQEEVDDADLP